VDGSIKVSVNVKAIKAVYWAENAGKPNCKEFPSGHRLPEDMQNISGSSVEGPQNEDRRCRRKDQKVKERALFQSPTCGESFTLSQSFKL